MKRLSNEKTWFYQTITGTVSGGGNIAPTVMIGQAEGLLSTPVRMVRSFGSWSVLLSGIVAGAEHDINIWQGVLLCSDEALGTEKFINSSGDDENLAWIWREPMVLFPCGRQSGAGTTYHVESKFDWSYRGGKGSTLGDGQNFEHVVSIDLTGAGAITSAKYSWRGITLFSVA